MAQLHELYKQSDLLREELLSFPSKERRAYWELSEEERAKTRVGANWDAQAKIAKQIFPIEKNFEIELQEVFGLQAAGDDKLAVEIYRALCNVSWEHEDGSRYSGTWRYAGEVVADLRQKEESYLDFYCSGGEGTVSDYVEESLRERGWSHSEMA